ncbi:unnamed protein product [Dicrocoelium dendriticum]|nr:unnamed protein product [Dicrocoelium dendriticum]
MVDVHLLDSHLTSMSSLGINSSTKTVNLHHNSISKLEGLESAFVLEHLDVSSNSVLRIENLEALKRLRTLNLSSNRISEISGLRNLRRLVRLDLSFNAIENLRGLLELSGPEYSLTVLQLQGNRIASLDHLLHCTSDLINLRQLTLMDPHTDANNPVCLSEGYRSATLEGLPQLSILDNLDRLDRPLQVNVLSDVPELTDFLDCISTTSLCELNELERMIQEYCIQKGSCEVCPRGPMDVERSSIQTESHNVHAIEGMATDKRPQCSISSTTEQRLLNLENQLSSLIALQLTHLNHPGDGSCPSSRDYDQSPDVPPCKNSATAPNGRQRLSNYGECHVDEKFPSAELGDKHSREDGINSTAHPPSGSDRVPAPNKQPRTTQIPKLPNVVTPSFATAGLTTKSSSEDHPPGAPKKPVMSRPNSRMDLHPSHGKPILPRRPLSTPGQPPDASRIIPVASVGSDSNAVRRPSHNVKKSATSEAKISQPDQVSNTGGVADRTLGQLLKELDSERAQRKHLEQLCQDLTGRILRLEASATDEVKALEATEQLKQAFTNERRARLLAESRLRDLDTRLSEVLASLEAMCNREEANKVRTNEETSKMSARLMDLAKDYKNAIDRAEKAEKMVDELHAQLGNLESVNRELTEKRFTIDSPEVLQLISARIDVVEARHEQTIKSLNEKLKEADVRFHALEDEFRLALRIEAERYGELYSTAEALKQKLTDSESLTKDLEQREESARQLVAQLTSAMKEQKSKALSQQKANLLLQHNQKERIVALEAQLEEAQNRLVSAENLRQQEHKQLKAELAAQESLVMGLRAERRNWSEELAKQGSALSQDRGRLEAKIEAQTLEIASLKKSLETEVDCVKIKTKMVDDHVETIRNLKKGLMDNQTEMKRIQEDALATQRQMEEQIRHLQKNSEENLTKIERLVARKEELKDTVTVLESRIEELQTQNESLSDRWRERSTLLDKLEKQMEQMTHRWEHEKQELVTERDKAQEQIKELRGQMEFMDAGFRQQLQAVTESKDVAMSAVREEAEQLRSNCESRVADVEAEMRAVLIETEKAKAAMETRLRQVSAALSDPINREPGTPPLRMCHSSQSMPYQPFPMNFGWISPPLLDNRRTKFTPPPAFAACNFPRAGQLGGLWRKA